MIILLTSEGWLCSHWLRCCPYINGSRRRSENEWGRRCSCKESWTENNFKVLEDAGKISQEYLPKNSSQGKVKFS